MTEHSSTRADASRIRDYIALLEEKNKHLISIAQSSLSLRTALDHDLSESIDSILAQRGQQCLEFVEICRQTRDDEALIETARNAVGQADGQLRHAASELLVQKSKSDSLAQEILDCQKQCEIILKSRLESTSRALKTSVQRRKLDAAYGPAHKHAVPNFLDKQR
ncbi:MAG: hypothetical protein ABFD83_00715 [Armatimonadota bacterium]